LQNRVKSRQKIKTRIKYISFSNFLQKKAKSGKDKEIEIYKLGTVEFKISKKIIPQSIYSEDINLEVYNKGTLFYKEKFDFGLLEIPLAFEYKDYKYIVFDHYSGGAHCCHDLFAFAIDKDNNISKIELPGGGHSGIDESNLVVKNGKLYIALVDWRFAYFYTSFADSIAFYRYFLLDGAKLKEDNRPFESEYLKESKEYENKLKALYKKYKANPQEYISSKIRTDAELDMLPEWFSPYLMGAVVNYIMAGQREKAERLYDEYFIKFSSLEQDKVKSYLKVKDKIKAQIFGEFLLDLLHIIQAHKKSVEALVFTPDGKKLISAGSDGKVKVWDLASGKVIKQISGYDAVISPDGRFVAYASNDQMLKVMDYESGKLLWSSKKLKGLTSIAFSPDGKYVASGSLGDQIVIWNAENGEIIKQFKGFKGYIKQVLFSPDGSKVIGTDGIRINVYDINTGDMVLNIKEKKQFVYIKDPEQYIYVEPISAIDVSTDGKYLLSAGSLYTAVKVFDMTTGKLAFVLKDYKTCENKKECNIMMDFVKISPDMKFVVACGDNAYLRIWDWNNKKLVAMIGPLGKEYPKLKVAISPDSKLIAVGNFEGHVWIYKISE